MFIQAVESYCHGLINNVIYDKSLPRGTDVSWPGFIAKTALVTSVQNQEERHNLTSTNWHYLIMTYNHTSFSFVFVTLFISVINLRVINKVLVLLYSRSICLFGFNT